MANSHSRNQNSVPKGNIDLGKIIHAFEVTNRTLNKSPKTTDWHSNNLRLFKDFLLARSYSLAIGDIGLQEAREYILYLQERKKYEGHPLTPARDERLSPQTIRAHVETLKAFFSWLHQEGYVDDNPLEHVAFPKVPQKLKEILSKEEVERLLSGCDRETQWDAGTPPY